MLTAHLFAGAGGGILADLILGHQPIVAVEWDAYACAVLLRQFTGMRVIEGDVRAVDFTRELVGVNALCAGFPCTDISAANPRGKGIDGERSGLYREVMRAVDAIRPEWVFLENSPRIRTKGRHIVIGDLVARGYSWRDGILSAADVGAPHGRARWWLLAHHDRVADPGSNRSQDTVQGGGADAPESDQIEAATGCDQRTGWWEAEPPVGRVADGLAAGAYGRWSQRIKCLGNGQVPLCAAAAWKLLGGP
jgi:DNA (cytosine-5)-methyltransferase 1